MEEAGHAATLAMADLLMSRLNISATWTPPCLSVAEQTCGPL